MLKKLRIPLVLIILVISLASSGYAAVLDDYPGWVQVNTDGFGDPRDSVMNLEVFNGYLYASTGTEDGDVAKILRSSDGRNWQEVSPPWASENLVVNDMVVFNGSLYAGTENWSFERGSSDGGEIWRTSDGTTWENVVSGGFNDHYNPAINALHVFKNKIYAATSTFTTDHGTEIWRSDSGDINTWSQVNTNGFDGGRTYREISIDDFDGFLYVGIARFDIDDNLLAELWRSEDGTVWTSVFTDGLGNENNLVVSSMEEYDGSFFIGIGNLIDGGQVWRSDNGSDWTNVFSEGLGNINNGNPQGLMTYEDSLIVIFSNVTDGVEVWRSADANTWNQIAGDGWGDPSYAWADFKDKGASVFNGNLYIATLLNYDLTKGGKIWLYLDNRIYLPMVVNN